MLYVHRKTYEHIIIVSCDGCHFSSSFEPSKEAYYGDDEIWKEFTANYRKVREYSNNKLPKAGHKKLEVANL